MPVLDEETGVTRRRTRNQNGPGSRVAALVWGMFASAAVVTMIGLGPVRPARSDAPGLATPVHTIGAGWTDSQCNGCHTVEPVFSHPVGIRPGRPLPARFPLQGGKMTCLTCHDGDRASSHTEARRAHSPLLRSPFEGGAFCAECHEQDPFSDSMGHARAVSKAHLVWPEEGLDRDVRSTAGGLDSETASCLECHDGAMARGAGGGHGGGDLFRRGASQEHPVGVAYASGRDRRGMNRLVDARSLDKRVRLFEGTVGCGSCHSVYSPLKNQLVMSNQRSALCLSCHDG